MKIIPLQEKHYPSVAKIYHDGLNTGNASFETIVPSWVDWDNKFLEECRFVGILNEEVVAWCALSQVSKRNVYRGVAENTIYVSKEHGNKGLGKKLLKHLIIESEKHGFWTLQAGIFTSNEASIALHEKCGFRRVGIREKIAKRDSTWHDNVIMERRSKTIN